MNFVKNRSHYLQLWTLSDRAQLENFTQEHQTQEIMVGFNRYQIKEGNMNENNVPELTLVNVRTGEVHWVLLSLIDSEYGNFSAISYPDKAKLLERLGINPDEV